MNVAFPTFERQLLIVQDLYIRPASNFDFDSLWKTHLWIYFHADPGTVVLILIVCPIYEFPESVANVSQGTLVPVVNWQIWKTNPHRDSLGNIDSMIKVRSPFVQIEALRTHEIRPILKDQVLTQFGDAGKGTDA